MTTRDERDYPLPARPWMGSARPEPERRGPVVHQIEAAIDGVLIDDVPSYDEAEVSYRCSECAFEGTIEEAVRHMIERQYPA
jgi:hypothetical protein